MQFNFSTMHKLKNFLVIIFLMISSTIGLMGQEVAQFSLKQAQEYAVKNSAQMKNADIDIQIARKKIWETTAIGLPQVNAEAKYQHLFKVPEMVFGGQTVLATDLPAGTVLTADNITNQGEGRVFLDFIPGQPIPLGAKNNKTIDFTVTQLIFSGEYLVGLRASKVFYMISDQSRQKTESDLRESVANTYSLALMLKNNHEVMLRSYENLAKTLNEMREMNKQGFVELTDVDQIELTTLTLENGINSMDRQIAAVTALLKFQIGYPMDKEIELTDNLEGLAQEVNLETLVNKKFNVSNNINYQIMETQVKLNKLNLQREKSTFLPSIAAAYIHTEKFTEIDFDFTPTDLFILSLNWSLFSSGQRIVKVQQRRLEYDKSVINRDNVAAGMELEYINARNEMLNAYDTYNNVKKNLELTERIYNKTLIKFKEGLSTSMDLTQAQNQLLSAQSEYINNMNSLLTAKNKLSTLFTN